MKQKFSWFPEDGNCPDVFDSIEAAIQDAQERYDIGIEPYDDGDEYTSAIIHVGPVCFFDLKNATEEVVENIEDNIYEQLHDFTFGCDIEVECYVSKKDKDAFKAEAVEALLPIIKKYLYTNPDWVCTPAMKYDLKNKKEIKI